MQTKGLDEDIRVFVYTHGSTNPTSSFSSGGSLDKAASFQTTACSVSAEKINAEKVVSVSFNTNISTFDKFDNEFVPETSTKLKLKPLALALVLKQPHQRRRVLFGGISGGDSDSQSPWSVTTAALSAHVAAVSERHTRLCRASAVGDVSVARAQRRRLGRGAPLLLLVLLHLQQNRTNLHQHTLKGTGREKNIAIQDKTSDSFGFFLLVIV